MESLQSHFEFILCLSLRIFVNKAAAADYKLIKHFETTIIPIEAPVASSIIAGRWIHSHNNNSQTKRSLRLAIANKH